MGDVFGLCQYGRREQDVDAMLQLYEAQDELMVVGDSGRYVRGYEEAGMNIDKLSIKQKIIDKLSVNDGNTDKIYDYPQRYP